MSRSDARKPGKTGEKIRCDIQQKELSGREFTDRSNVQHRSSFRNRLMMTDEVLIEGLSRFCIFLPPIPWLRDAHAGMQWYQRGSRFADREQPGSRRRQLILVNRIEIIRRLTDLPTHR